MIPKLPLIFGLTVALIGSGAAEESRSDLFSQQPGRYQIVTSPQSAKFTFLIDTATGRIWQLATFTDIKGDPTIWEIMPRIDSNEELTLFVKQRGVKPGEEPVASSVKPKQPVQLR
jgi:hypothetical protein